MSQRRRNRSQQGAVSDQVEIIEPSERAVPGFLGKVSDYILDNSQLPIFLGAVTSAALLGYHISVRAEGLKETTDLTLLGFRSTYTPQAVYDLFEELGPEGRAEYQYINVLGTGAFPALVSICFATAISQLFTRAKLPHEWNLLPLLYLAMATAENLVIAYLLFTYPRVQLNVAAILGIAAGFRFRLLTYTALSVLFGAVWMVKVRVQTYLHRKQR